MKLLMPVARALKRIVVGLRLSSIQSIITLSFTAITLISLVIVSVSAFSLFSDSAEKNAALSSQQIMNQVNVNLNSYLQGMMQISDLIRSNLDSNTYRKGSLADFLNAMSKIRSDIATTVVYSDKGDIIAISPKGVYDKNYSVTDQDWFESLVLNPANFIFLPPHVQRIFEDVRPWVVSFSRGITIYDQGKLVTLIIVVDMNFSAIEQACKQVSLGKRGYIYIVDQSGTLIYHPQQQILYAGLKSENIEDALKKQPGSYYDSFQGEKRIMTVANISYTGWKMVGISYVDEVTANKQYFFDIMFFILLFGIIFVILASLFVSSKISQPVKKLEQQMKRVESGDFEINLEEVKGEDEVKRLSKAFNLMVARIRQLMAQNISEQEEKRKSELKALQAQINPHFLYNTLDSIVWMNENRNYEGVTTMVAALAKFFRISISKGNEIISVADEIEHAGSYLTIQKIRYKEKFDFTIDAQPEALFCRTLKLILQPMIENAIYHGIEPLNEKGHIGIKVYTMGSDIQFEVSDNGYGIRPETAKQLLSRESRSYHSGGVGFKNVNERIKLCYGREYGIEIESELDVGTTVKIRIPQVGPDEGGKL